MDRIFDDSSSIDDFNACIEKLGKKQFRELVIKNRVAVKKMHSSDKLVKMCEMGFFNAILPLVECGSEEQIFNAYKIFFGGGIYAQVAVSREDEIKLMKFASDKLRIIKFLRENTLIFEKYFVHREHLFTVVLNNGSQEVLDYLFDWQIKNHEYLDQKSGKVLFAKANKKTLKKYIDIVRGFSGDRNFLTYSMIEILYKRDNLTDDEKYEIMLYGLRKMRVCPKTFSELRKNGYIN